MTFSFMGCYYMIEYGIDINVVMVSGMIRFKER